MPNLPPLDDLDRAILECLGEDARIPNNQLAARVGVAPSTCLARVRALRESGVLKGFHAEIDLAALGRPLQAMIAVRLAVTPARRSRTSRARSARCPACSASFT
jgi:DNA-binding Lrp family transcriptional regulator